MSLDDLRTILAASVGVIGDEPAADLGAVGTADHHRVAAAEFAVDAIDAGRQQALAAAQRRDRAGIDGERALAARASPRSISCAR